MSKPLITISNAQSGFPYWSSLPSLTNELRESIKEADVVFVPLPGYGQYKNPVFPVGTEELFHYFVHNAPSNLKVELAIEDRDYRELSLHSDIVRIATLLVQYVAAPVVVGLVIDYVKKTLGAKFETAEVRFTMNVDKSRGDVKRVQSISYEGPAKTFESALSEALGSLDRKHKNKKGRNDSRSPRRQ